jgi:hypothetical protein
MLPPPCAVKLGARCALQLLPAPDLPAGPSAMAEAPAWPLGAPPPTLLLLKLLRRRTPAGTPMSCASVWLLPATCTCAAAAAKGWRPAVGPLPPALSLALPPPGLTAALLPSMTSCPLPKCDPEPPVRASLWPPAAAAIAAAASTSGVKLLQDSSCSTGAAAHNGGAQAAACC